MPRELIEIFTIIIITKNIKITMIIIMIIIQKVCSRFHNNAKFISTTVTYLASSFRKNENGNEDWK